MNRPTVTFEVALAQVVAEGRAKTAASYEPERDPMAAELRKLAGALRQAREPAVTFEDLNRVKVALAEGVLPTPTAPRDAALTGGPGDPFRKVAAELRAAGDRAEHAAMVKAAHVLCAAKGLTILQQKVRGWYGTLP